MISIICPFYNSENHITRTCKSIYSQKNFNSKIEVIYIDDGSTDKSLTLVHDEIVNNKNDKIYSKVIADEVDRKVNGLESVENVSVDLVWEPMWTRDMMSEAAQLELGMM